MTGVGSVSVSRGRVIDRDCRWEEIAFRLESNNKPILVVEDSEDDLYLLRHAFGVAGIRHPIVERRCGESAIRYLSQNGESGGKGRNPMPCLIITDIKMPRVDGFGLLEWLKERPEFASVPRVVFSSSARVEDQRRAAELGACAYFVKPSGLNQLVEIAHDLNEEWIKKHCGEARTG